MISPTVTQEKFRNACSRMARGLETSKKSTDWGCNLTKVALGKLTFDTVNNAPSSKFKLRMTQNGT